MKKCGWIIIAGLLVGGAHAEMVYFKGIDAETVTTGDLLEGVQNLGITTNVQEISGLFITARSAATNQQLNANNSYFGINDILTTNEVADAFDAGERMIISFSKDIEIHRLDFNRFTTDESIMLSVGGDTVEIHDLDLTNRSSDYLDTNIVVTADTEIEFYTTGSSVVGLDGIELTVPGGSDELMLSFFRTNGTSYIAADFEGAAADRFVLQASTNLASNVWNTVSGEFNSDTNIDLNTTHDVQYFRAIAQ